MPSKRLIVRHVIVSFSFVILYLPLNRPEVIFISRIGFVAWYPAIGRNRAPVGRQSVVRITGLSCR